jgi:quercetin dioxygenase-like cupin family protein
MEFQLRRASQSEAGRIEEDWGGLCWLASQKIGNAKGITIGRVIIKKGKSNPRHSHSHSEEVLYLLCGRLEHTVGKEMVVMEPGDTLVVPPGIAHNATSIGEEDADMIVAYPTGLRDFRLES